MKTFILLMLITIFFSCAKNEILLPEVESTQVGRNDFIGEITTETGLQSLKLDLMSGNQDITWEDLHENYLTAVEKYKNHEDWNIYFSSLILFQMEKTSILEDINADNYTILETYLEELKLLNTAAYPKFHYQMLSTLKPFMTKEKIASYAMNSYKKGVEEKEKSKDHSEDITEEMAKENAFNKLVRDMLQKYYKENYIIYLPKLKEFF